MYLRVTAVRSSPDKLEAGIANFKEKVIPAIDKAPGFGGATLIVNKESGLGAAGTLWESLEAMNKAEEAGQQARTQSEEVTGAEVTDVDRFEITVMEMAGTTPVLPSFTRVTTAYASLDKVAAIEALTKNEVAPKVKSEPGFRAIAAGVNRMTGRGFVSVSYATEKDRAAGESIAAELRQKAAEAGAYGINVQLAETVVAEIKLPVKA